MPEARSLSPCSVARAHPEAGRALGPLRVPETTIARVLGWTTGTPARAPLWPDLDAALHAALDPEVRELVALVPDLDLSLWPNFRHLGTEARGAPPAGSAA